MIFIALGSNLSGQSLNPSENIAKAYAALEKYGVSVVKRSTIWLTEPVPLSDQPWYHNSVVSVETSLSSKELLQTLHKIEEMFGRVRKVRNEARVLDLDLIAYNDEIINNEEIEIPHPRMYERSFVLVPLCEVEPNWVHPLLQKTSQELLFNLPEDTYKETMHKAA